MRSTSFLIILSVLVAFISGVAFEHYRSRHTLAACHALNTSLYDDLGRAVARGVEMETNLNLCKERNHDRNR